MSRRRKGLGASQAQHYGDQQDALRRIGVDIATVRHELSEDRCGAAARTMLSTAHDWGRYNSEKSHTQRSTPDENRISNAYADVRETFLNRCVRKKQA